MEGNIKGKLACLNLEVAQFLLLNLNGKRVNFEKFNVIEFDWLFQLSSSL